MICSRRQPTRHPPHIRTMSMQGPHPQATPIPNPANTHPHPHRNHRRLLLQQRLGVKKKSAALARCWQRLQKKSNSSRLKSCAFVIDPGIGLRSSERPTKVRSPCFADTLDPLAHVSIVLIPHQNGSCTGELHIALGATLYAFD